LRMTTASERRQGSRAVGWMMKSCRATRVEWKARDHAGRRY
jgi:hypothetical protein